MKMWDSDDQNCMPEWATFLEFQNIVRMNKAITREFTVIYILAVRLTFNILHTLDDFDSLASFINSFASHSFAYISEIVLRL